MVTTKFGICFNFSIFPDLWRRSSAISRPAMNTNSSWSSFRKSATCGAAGRNTATFATARPAAPQAEIWEKSEQIENSPFLAQFP